MFHTNLRLDDELAEKIKEIAKNDMRSMNTVSILALHDYV